MNVWKPASIKDEPEVILSQWNVMRLLDGSRHFVGWNVMLGEGRVSSAIKEFDNTTMSGKTQSGRIYQLNGPSRHNADASYVWTIWCKVNKIDPGTAIIVNEEFENVV